MDFGITVLPDPPASRFVDLVQAAEQAGFTYGWTYDSHILWQEGYVFLTMGVQATSVMHFGHCVTNPAIRDPTVTASAYATLQDVSGGRMILGIGRGDSSRRVTGLKPVTIKEFERSLRMIKGLMNGREVDWNDKRLRLEWVREGTPEIPMAVAAYGPRALGVTGRVGDALIIQLGDVEITKWLIDQARAAAVAEGRDPDAIRPIVCAPAVLDRDLAVARDQVRWFPAMVSNHIKDIIARHGEGGDIPHALTDYAKAVESYDYAEHSRIGAQHGKYISDEICDRFCFLGEAEDHQRKISELQAIGVDQVNLYLMTNDMDGTLARYGRDVIPALSSSSSAVTA
jgi:probable F420-dependent oxidoreductase